MLARFDTNNCQGYQPAWEALCDNSECNDFPFTVCPHSSSSFQPLLGDFAQDSGVHLSSQTSWHNTLYHSISGRPRISLASILMTSLLPRVTWILPTLISLNFAMASEWLRPATDWLFTEKISSPERHRHHLEEAVSQRAESLWWEKVRNQKSDASFVCSEVGAKCIDHYLWIWTFWLGITIQRLFKGSPAPYVSPRS